MWSFSLSLRVIKVSRVSFGEIPPRIGGVKVYPSNRTVSRDEIIFEVEVTWASECDLEVVVRQTQDFVSLGVKDILVQGQLRVTLAPLLDVAPLVGGVRLSFIEEPHINFDLEGVARCAHFLCIQTPIAEPHSQKLLLKVWFLYPDMEISLVLSNKAAQDKSKFYLEQLILTLYCSSP